MNALQLDDCYCSPLHKKKMTRKKILIVDDEEHLRELVQLCIEDLAGWDTLVAGSGKECLEILETEKPNAILLDVSMPEMDGLVVCEYLQSNPITRSIPVILLTARVLPRDLAKFTQMGIAGIIPKPFQPVTLTQEVTNILGWNS